MKVSDKPNLYMINFAQKMISVTLPGKKIEHFPMKGSIVEVFKGGGKMMSRIDEVISMERGRIVSVEKFMKKVRGRSRLKSATLEELLDIE